MSYVPWPGFGPFESYDADELVAGGERLELAGLEIDVLFTPGHSPGHVTYSIPAEQAVFSGDVLFQGSIGRTDLPGGDTATLMRTLAELLDTLPDETTRLPRPHGRHHARPRARDQPVPARARPDEVSPKIQAPRGTYDVLGDDALARDALEEHARRILERAGYARIETPAFEATELFARGVGESTDVVQKEMYTLDEGPSESLTLRPEGTAPVCRAYLEHGMHKLPQPVKLWYLSSFFRRERPQAGRFRQFWQVGAEAIGSADPAVDAELILLLAELLEAVGARGLRLRLSSLGTPETREQYRAELQDYLRAHEAELSAEVRARIDLNPLRAFDADHPGTRRVMEGAPLLLDRLDAEDAEHFATVRELLDAAGVAVRGRPDARARARLLHAHGVRVHLRRARRPERRRRRRALRRADGDHRRPADARAWAGRPGSSGSCSASPPPPVAPPPLDLYVAYAGPEHAGAAFRLAADARRAGHSARLELGGRSLKGQLKQADRAGARYVAILGDDGTALKDMESGEQKTVETETVMHHIRGGL